MKKDIASLQVAKNKCNDVLQCVLKLNSLEVTSYKLLVDRGPMRSDELAGFIGKDRSTAYRCLKHLISCGICTKDAMTIESGGRFHVYTAVPPETVKVKLKECTEQWYHRTCAAVEGFPYED